MPYPVSNRAQSARLCDPSMYYSSPSRIRTETPLQAPGSKPGVSPIFTKGPCRGDVSESQPTHITRQNAIVSRTLALAFLRAEDGIRTRDFFLGKEVRYQTAPLLHAGRVWSRLDTPPSNICNPNRPWTYGHFFGRKN